MAPACPAARRRVGTGGCGEAMNDSPFRTEPSALPGASPAEAPAASPAESPGAPPAPAMRPGLSIVIPVYRGAATIGRLVDALSDLRPAGGLEIILVND